MMMKIKILTSCAGLDFSYAAGETVDAPAGIGKDLIKAGFAEEVKPTPKKGKGGADADAG